MKLCEQLSDKGGISLSQLMDNAGEALARQVLEICMRRGLKKCLILAGKGNNGGDGFVAANLLADSSMEVTVMLPVGEPGTELAKAAFSKLNSAVKIADSAFRQEFVSQFDIIIDCVFGTGFHGSLDEKFARLFALCNQSSALRIACDVPSGCDASSGLADENSFKADLTVTFHKKKLGLALSPCRYFCGEVITADIGIDESLEDGYKVTLCDEEYVKGVLPQRVPYGNKGTFGKVTAVCGSDRYIGAAAMSVMGALRTGVGLCELCSTQKTVAALSSSIFECIYTTLSVDSEGCISPDSAQAVIEKSRSSSCILIGCGLGNTKGTQQLVADIIQGSECPVVIDADGINSLAVNIDVLQKKKSDVILTPHPMELARLCSKPLEQVLSDRLGAARDIAEKYTVTVLAKSAESMAVTKEGCVLISAGNTALAKGGSGDMLAGITASLLAQGCTPADACAAASFIMGSTAQMLCQRVSPRSVLARDILSSIGEYLMTLEG